MKQTLIFTSVGLAFIVFSLAMISGGSYWIDEGTTAWFAMQESFSGMWNTLQAWTNSEGYMPLYMVFVWLWAQVVPFTEWLMRLSNVLWGGGTVLAALYGGRRCKVSLAGYLLLVQPFFWLYMNELRPYTALMCAGFWQLAAVVDVVTDKNPQGRAVVFVVASLAICSLHLLGIFPLLVSIAALLFFYLSQRRWPAKAEIGVYLLGGLFLAVLGVYYLKKMMVGAGAAQLWSWGVVNLAYSLYEFIGFSGVGPAPLALREAGRAGVAGVFPVLKPFLIFMILYGSLLLCVFLIGIKNTLTTQTDRSKFFLFTAMGLGVFSLLCGLAYFAHWPFWGRHMAVLFPFYHMGLAVIVQNAWRSKAGRPFVAGCIMVMLSASLSLRFHPRFERDDYGGAAALAKDDAACGRVVWWVATRPAAKVYGLAFSIKEGGCIVDASNLHDVEGLPDADLVLMNRPEATDHKNTVQNYLVAGEYQKVDAGISNFTVWRRIRDEQP